MVAEIIKFSQPDQVFVWLDKDGEIAAVGVTVDDATHDLKNRRKVLPAQLKEFRLCQVSVETIHLYPQEEISSGQTRILNCLGVVQIKPSPDS